MGESVCVDFMFEVRYWHTKGLKIQTERKLGLCVCVCVCVCVFVCVGAYERESKCVHSYIQ